MPKSKSKRKLPQRKPRPSKQRAQSTAAGNPEFASEVSSLGEISTSGKPIRKESEFAIKGVSDRVDGFFQLAAILPFFSTAWIENGLLVKDSLTFTVLLGALILGSLARSVNLRKDEIPFPGQLIQFIAIGAGVLCFAVYYLTGSVEATLLTASATVLRILAFLLDIRNVFSLCLYGITLVVSTTLLAPLGAFLGSGIVYLPFFVFGVVPGFVLAAAEVLRYSPILEKDGWTRAQMGKTRDGKEVQRPGSLTRLLVLLLIAGPVVPAFLASFEYIPIPFMITVVSLYGAPAVAEGFQNKSTDESVLYGNVIRVAITAIAAMFLAAQL